MKRTGIPKKGGGEWPYPLEVSNREQEADVIENLMRWMTDYREPAIDWHDRVHQAKSVLEGVQRRLRGEDPNEILGEPANPTPRMRGIPSL